MVYLEAEDYSEILNWFTHKYGLSQDPKGIPPEAMRVFWKLTFLAEDKIGELREKKREDEKDE